MVVKDLKVVHDQASLRAAHLNRNRVVAYRNHPKHVVPINVHVVIMNLGNQTGRSNRTGIHVKSNECERALMLTAVRADKPALTEAHVGLKRQPRRDASRGVGSCSPAANVRQSNEPVEIGDL
jgi:hypothetical protein